MKIINGEYSGRNIYMPEGIRPTQNMLRKAIFDIIGHDLAGMSFLELFAGSGAVGIEALSCGAAEVCQVEHNPKNVKVIEENLMLIKPSERGLKAYVLKQDAFFSIKEFARQNKRFHVVFFDPPFGLKLARKTLKTLMTHDILAPHSYVVAQYDQAERLPEVDASLKVIKDKVYGSSRLTVFEHNAEEGVHTVPVPDERH
jgi:16S rRNA (guanine966-N2)-methyltransferase